MAEKHPILAEKDPTEEEKRQTMTKQQLTETQRIQDASVLVKFITKQRQYAVSGASVSVKSKSTPKDLNEIIKAFILQGIFDGVELPEFEFLVCDQLLVGQLGRQLLDANISFEKVVKVEYFEKQPPPTPKDSLQHDDWVAALQCSEDWLVTGCYDNTVHLWDAAGLEAGQGEKAHRLTIPAHRAPVKAVAWIQTEGPTKSFISTSIDQTAVIWVWHSESNAVECVSECRGHTQSVECVAVDESKELFATGSWDNTLKIWLMSENAEKDEIDIDQVKEKRRRSAKKPAKKTPLLTLAGHTENVGGVEWTGPQEVTTVSWDHSLRVWDTDIGGIKSQIISNCAFFSLSWSPLTRTILASCADRHIRLYDPRITVGHMVQQKYTSHSKWVPSVKWSTSKSHLFVSGGYDNLVKLWDCRSPKAPLYDLKGHEDKVLAVDWSNSRFIASGAADCTAKVFSSNDKLVQ